MFESSVFDIRNIKSKEERFFETISNYIDLYWFQEESINIQASLSCMNNFN